MYSYTTLLLALLSTTALATPLHPPTTNSTLNPRATEKGTPTGLTISIWSVPNCHGTPDLSNTAIALEENIAQQTLSYSLSDDLGVDMVMGFFVDTAWTATGDDAVKAGEDGDVNNACATLAYNADAENSKAGCHSLPKAIGCVFVSNT